MAKSASESPQKGSQPVKYFKDQFDDEEVLLVFRKHPVVMRKGLVIGSLGLLVGPLYVLALTYLKPNNPPSINFFFGSIGISFVIAAILFFPSWLSWFYSVYIVTNQRLIQISQKGLFHRSIVGINLNQIQMVNYEVAGLQETLLGFGTINIQTFVGSLTIHEVHHPPKIQKELLNILREQGINTSTSPVEDGMELADEET
jgi:uncharacterized membrane protein YdbT with pleckstrin-like domain